MCETEDFLAIAFSEKMVNFKYRHAPFQNSNKAMLRI